MFHWLHLEIEQIKTRKFHQPGIEPAREWEPQIDWPVPPPEDYRQFIAEFGPSMLYRSLGWWLVRIFSRTVLYQDAKHGPFLQFGGFDAGVACFLQSDLERGVSRVYETRGVSGLFVTAASFEEWLAGASRRAKKRYRRREWQEIVAGPAPFTREEEEIVAARRMFEWKLLGVTTGGKVTLEITNHSSRTLPRLSLGIRGPRLHGRSYVLVADILPGMTKIVGHQGYTCLKEPEKQVPYALPDPEPEDREYYREFRSLEAEAAAKLASGKTAIEDQRRWFRSVSRGSGSGSVDSSDPSERMKAADALVGAGRDAEALENYLWCFDHGMAACPAFAGVRSSFLLDRILKLGGKLRYRPALAALLERRDACENRLKSGDGTRQDAHDFADLSRCFKQQHKTVALFESVPANAEIRDALAWSLREYFLENRRYADLLLAFDPEETFKSNLADLEMNACAGLKSALRDKLLRFCNPLVEALAGTGQHDRALVLARNILRAVGRPHVRQDLITHAGRAGDSKLAAILSETARRERNPGKT
jgi:hypothetical protein